MHKNLLPRLLLSVTVLLLLRHLLALLPAPASWQWQVADVMRAMGMAATLALVAQLIPWNQLRYKCFAAALCGYYVADAVLCAIWYGWGAFSPLLQAVVQGVAFGLAGIWYAWRSYDQPSDPLNYDHVFCLRKRPESLQDFLISLLGCFGSQGAYAIYAGGTVYHFRHGVLVATIYDGRAFGAKYIATRGRHLQMSHIMALDALRGVKWSPLTNCITVLGAFWRKHGR